MLMADCGEIAGMVSGGCLEQDILCHVQQQTPPYDPFVITYDTTTDEDILWGFGLGCEGVVWVLVEPLASSLDNPLMFIAECFKRQKPGVLATVYRGIESVVLVGTKLMLPSEGAINSNIEDAELSAQIVADAQVALQQQTTMHRQYHLPLGQVEVFIEVIQPPPHLVIFGAGRDALPLAQFATALGWALTIVDCRSLEATYDCFPMADQIILARREAINQQVDMSAQTIAVIMTHNYLDDLEILRSLLTFPARYIGVLGARQRTARLIKDLSRKEFLRKGLPPYAIPSEHFQRLHAPIGLDIGSETPEEIAIAIIAEIQAVMADRAGGFLKNRQASIHRPQSSHSSPPLNYALRSPP